MALTVDLVFAGELAQLCGAAVWNEVRAAVGERFRAMYANADGNFRQYALAAMLATGADDFSDIVVPFLSGQDGQARLVTYRLWPDIHVSSLGPSWRAQVRGWSEEARTDFVSELLHHRLDDEIAEFAAEDDSPAVKEAAADGLLWTGADDALTRVLESMDVATFEGFARQNAAQMPASLRPSAIAMTRFVESTQDFLARLRTALHLVDLGQEGLGGIIKEAMKALSGGDTRNLDSHYVREALRHLRKIDPDWVSEWVAVHVAEGALYEHEHWLSFAPRVPAALGEKYLQRLESENLRYARLEGMLAVIAACADAELAARVFAKVRELRSKMSAEPGQWHDYEWQVVRQLDAVFRRLPDDVAAAGVLSSVTSGDALDIKIAADLFSRVGRSDVEPLHVTDSNLKARLRAYLKGCVDLVLEQDDFSGKEKANLASSIAQVGQPEDMADLVTLVRADIARMRRGRAARAAGDRGPRGNGSFMSHSRWHIDAVMHLDAAGAEQVLIDLLPEPEYVSDAAAAMASDFAPKSERSFDRTFRYDMMWDARESRTSPPIDEQRRTRFAAALNAEIKRLRGQQQDAKPAVGLKELAKALAAVDAHGSAAVVVEVIGQPGEWDHYTCLDAAERLLAAGVVLPATPAFTLVDATLRRVEESMQASDRYLLGRVLALCPFTDDPAAGIAKLRDVFSKRRHWSAELRQIVVALGQSRSPAAVDLLYELASDTPTFQGCEDSFIAALAALDTPRARELLMGFVDPDIRGIAVPHSLYREDALVAHLVELARGDSDVAARLCKLCERDLPDSNRHILSKVMDGLATTEALAANLSLIDDARPLPIPQGVWDQIEAAFIERRPYGQTASVFTMHARATNKLRVRLFSLATEDERRRKAACVVLGQIEEWRLEHGRPPDEPRHPDLASGRPWPLS